MALDYKVHEGAVDTSDISHNQLKVKIYLRNVIMSLKPVTQVGAYMYMLTVYFTFVCMCVCAHACAYMLRGFGCQGTCKHVEIRDQPWIPFLRSHPPCLLVLSQVLLCSPG